MQKFLTVFCFVLLFSAMAMGQGAVDITVTVSDNAPSPNSKVLNFGLDLNATTGIDPLLGESDLPPFPPPGVFEARWNLQPFGAGNLSTYKDYRNAPAFPYTGAVENRLWWQLGEDATTFTINYDLPAEATILIKDVVLDGGIFNSGVLSGSGSYTITVEVTEAKFIISYDNINVADPGPTFSVNPVSLVFGNVAVGNNSTEQLTVSNTGTTNPLTITSASIINTDYAVVPNPPTAFPVVINAGDNYNFDVTFTPALEGVSAGDVEFVHDAAGSPSTVPVTGNGTDPTLSQLLFKADQRLRYDNDTYTDTLQLVYNGEPLNALSFKLKSNPPDADPDNVLILTGVEKGSDIASADWNFFFEEKGAGDSAYFIVLIYGQDSTTLTSGTYEDLVRFTYDIINITGIDTLRSYFRLDEVESSLINGDPAEVTGDDDQVIDVVNQLDIFYGDINNDGVVDLADLILIREYILERIDFTPEEFERADLAPWASGNLAPSPDGKVNVQDLALLQNIILTGTYPSGEPSAARPGMNMFTLNNNSSVKTGAATTVKIYINSEAITVHTSSDESIIGMQLELSGIDNINQGMVIGTGLGSSFYYYDQSADGFLRTLLYDRAGKIELPAGENYAASIPVKINNPDAITVENVVLVNSSLQKIPNINVEIILDGSTAIPTDYSLSQNYPNPFNPETQIQFSIPQEGFVVIKIYDMLGQEVATLFNGHTLQGRYTLNWNGKDNSGNNLSSGTYVYRMTAGDFVSAKKMVLVK